MRVVRAGIAVAAIAWTGAAQATTVVIFVDSMSMQRHTRVIDTPGPDRFLMCVEPPAVTGCTELPIKKKGR